MPENRNTVTIPTTAHLWKAAAGGQINGPLIARAQDLADEARAFHWPLQFPDVFEKGGFDVVLGNPPWERIKLQEREFFAARAPEIAEAPNAAARGRMIASLAKSDGGTRERKLHEAFEFAKRTAEAVSTFARIPAEDSGRFPLAGRGDVNTYALFAELFSQLVSRRGRAGVIVPTGIATDATTAPFFSALIDNRRLVSLFSFFEVRKVFLATDDRSSFCLLTLGYGVKLARFAFFLTDPAQLGEPERNFTLSPEQIAIINPNTKTAPVFRSQADAELTAKIYARVPVLIDESKGEKGKKGNPWGVSFARLFDMSNDSGLFRTAAQLQEAGFTRDGTDWVSGDGVRAGQSALDLAGGRDAAHLDLQGGGVRTQERYMPLYEAKMIHHFDHRWATYDGTESRDVTQVEKDELHFEPVPRYWVPQRDVDDRLDVKDWRRGWLMGWRDIARSTDERTVIATSFPRVGVNHKAPLFLVGHDPRLAAAMLASWASLALDFVARQKIGGTSPRVLELTYTSYAMKPFARDLGYDGPPFPWNDERRAHLRAELDAFYARAYGLSRDELRYILDPADVKGPDYPSETFRVLKNNEVRKFGEYRTQRLVLGVWDRFEAEGWPGEQRSAASVGGAK